MLLQPAGGLTEPAREALERCLGAHPPLAQGYRLKTRVQTRLAERDPAALDQWLHEAETSDLPPFRAMARSLRQDYDVVKAALTTPRSMGPCAGQISRVKRLKRLGYGRVKLDVRRQRILHRMVAPKTPADRARQVWQQGAA